MKSFFDTDAWKWIRTLLEVLLIAAIITGFILLVSAVTNVGVAEEWDEHEEEFELAWVICMKNDVVNVRQGASRSSCEIGRLESGTMVYLDGKKKHGYVHAVGLNTEYGEGWIHSGYLVDEEPEYVNCTAVIISKGRLAARKYVDGKRTRWLKPGAELKVYYWTDSWSLTNCGYVKSEFLELEETP